MDTNIMAEGLVPGPDGSLLRFFYDSAKNEQASISLGRAIFDTALYVDIITPGQNASTPRFEIERVFSEQSREALGMTIDKKRSYKYAELAEFVERFKRDEHQADLGGTPLREWPRIDRGLQATLAAVNIYTVEALAELSDTNLAYLGMGARELRENAKQWLAAAGKGSDTSKLVAENVDLKQENERIRAELVALNAAMEAQKAAKVPAEAGILGDII